MCRCDDSCKRFEEVPVGESERPANDPLYSTVLKLSAFLTAEECDQMISAADADLQSKACAHKARYGHPPQHPSSRSRLPVAKLACARARQCVEDAFQHILSFLEVEIPHVAQNVFGTSTQVLQSVGCTSPEQNLPSTFTLLVVTSHRTRTIKA